MPVTRYLIIPPIGANQHYPSHGERAARNRLGYTQAELGQMLDPPCGWRTIAHYEKGDYKPKSPRREQIMDILNLTPSNAISVPQSGGIGLPRHELVKGLLAIRSEVDGLLSRV